MLLRALLHNSFRNLSLPFVSFARRRRFANRESRPEQKPIVVNFSRATNCVKFPKQQGDGPTNTAEQMHLGLPILLYELHLLRLSVLNIDPIERRKRLFAQQLLLPHKDAKTITQPLSAPIQSSPNSQIARSPSSVRVSPA